MAASREDESPLQILVADDDSATRMLLNIALTKWGYQVLDAEDGDIAWRRISHPGAPRLLLLDCNMPKQSGYELCTRIRTELTNYNPYIILLTHDSGQENVIKGLDAGANEFLTKPFNAGELRSRILVGERIVRYEDALQFQNQRLQDYISKIETASDLVVNAAQSLSQAMKQAHDNGDDNLFADRYHDMKRAHSTLDEIIEVFSNYQPGKEPRKPE